MKDLPPAIIKKAVGKFLLTNKIMNQFNDHKTAEDRVGKYLNEKNFARAMGILLIAFFALLVIGFARIMLFDLE